MTNPDGGLDVAGPEVEVTAGSAPSWTTAAGQLGGGSLQKNASVNIAFESVEKLMLNSLDKSKLDKIFNQSVEETKLALQKKSS
mgnify:CR=1 FL=1